MAAINSTGSKGLTCKHKDLNSDPQNPWKELGMLACKYHPSTGEVEMGTSLELTSHLILLNL